MTLELNCGTKPEGLPVRMRGFDLGGERIHIGEYSLTMEDFISMTLYVLTNSNLAEKNDPRLQFVELVRSMKRTRGYPHMIDGKELETVRLKIDEALLGKQKEKAEETISRRCSICGRFLAPHEGVGSKHGLICETGCLL